LLACSIEYPKALILAYEAISMLECHYLLDEVLVLLFEVGFCLLNEVQDLLSPDHVLVDEGEFDETALIGSFDNLNK
jgi:hypothetical protein